MESLRQLRSTPQWRTYTEALQEVCNAELSRILSGLSHEQYLIAVGRFQSIETFASLIDHVDLKSQELDEHRRPADPNALDANRAGITFFGSPYWDAVRKRVPWFGPDRPNGNGTNG